MIEMPSSRAVSSARRSPAGILSTAILPAAILAVGLAAPLPAWAMPPVGPGTPGAAVQDAVATGAPDAAPGTMQGARIVQVYGGCGPLGHRGPYGGCRLGGQWGGYVPGLACPAGWHIGPYGHRCWRDW